MTHCSMVFSRSGVRGSHIRQCPPWSGSGRWVIHMAQDGIADGQALVADADIEVRRRGDEALHHVLRFVAEGAALGISFGGPHISVRGRLWD
jgi:hypothetical protein